MILIAGVKDDGKTKEKRNQNKVFFPPGSLRETNNYQTAIRTNQTHQLYTCQGYFTFTNTMFLMKYLHCHQVYSVLYQLIILFASAHQTQLFPRPTAFLCSRQEVLF